MGYETKCRVRVAEPGRTREADATVLLETDELVVRGEARIKIQRGDIRRVARRDGMLTIVAPAATLTLSLGEPAAARWEKKVAEPPKRLIDKLDVKPSASVLLIGGLDAALVAQLGERTTRVSKTASRKNVDVAFVEVGSLRHLDRIERAAAAIADDGAIWVIHPKGPTGVADTAIYARATELGLTYTKVARVSEALTGEKLVWPRASRASAKRAAGRRSSSHCLTWVERPAGEHRHERIRLKQKLRTAFERASGCPRRPRGGGFIAALSSATISIQSTPRNRRTAART